MRVAIDRNPRRLKDILRDEQIRREFLDGAKNNDGAAVKSFIKRNDSNALKTRPKVSLSIFHSPTVESPYDGFEPIWCIPSSCGYFLTRSVALERVEERTMEG